MFTTKLCFGFGQKEVADVGADADVFPGGGGFDGFVDVDYAERSSKLRRKLTVEEQKRSMYLASS